MTFAHTADSVHRDGDAGVLVLLVRRDAVEVAGDTGEYVAIRADRFGALQAALPGMNIDGQRSAAVHDDSTRRLLEEMLTEQRRMCDLLDALLSEFKGR